LHLAPSRSIPVLGPLHLAASLERREGVAHAAVLRVAPYPSRHLGDRDGIVADRIEDGSGELRHDGLSRLVLGLGRLGCVDEDHAALDAEA
jgi:hypothetical protein